MKIDSLILFLKTRLNSTLGKAVIGFIIACLVLRFPALTEWAGHDVQQPVLAFCYEVRAWGLGIILLFAKSYNQTGGTQPITREAEERTH